MNRLNRRVARIIREEYSRALTEIEDDDAAMNIDMALEEIANVHKELWGYEAIPRELMEQLDAQMQVINKNWASMTGIPADE